MMRRYVAEFVGTFGIVFAPVALAGASGLTGAASGLGAAALVSGLVVSAMVYALGPISAAHFNPAVTVAFAAAGRFPFRFVLPYCMAQTAGAIVAAGACAFLFGAGYGTHAPGAGVSWGQALCMESVLTFFLMLVIMAVATDKRVDGAVPGLAIGLTVVFDVLVGGAVSGGSMNPARTLGPALFAGAEALRFFPLYLVGPLVGAAAAALLYEQIRPSPTHAKTPPTIYLPLCKA